MWENITIREGTNFVLDVSWQWYLYSYVAMIALRLRSNGHSREAVEETIRACAPTIRVSQTGRNWQWYAERTADYAFGPAGDRDMERNERYREMWRRVEVAKEKWRPQLRTR